MMELLCEDEETILKEVRSPQLILTAGNDHENCQPGGLVEKVRCHGYYSAWGFS